MGEMSQRLFETEQAELECTVARQALVWAWVYQDDQRVREAAQARHRRAVDSLMLAIMRR